MARLIAQKMSENMGTTVLVENKAGGNFIPALKELTGSPRRRPYALLHLDQHADHPAAASGLSVRSDQVRRRSREVATGPLILVVKNDLGVKTLKELIELAKQNPGKLTFGAGGGTGSSLYFATELLKAKAGIKITIVQLPRRRTRAQRSARRPHRRHVRRHAGDGRRRPRRARSRRSRSPAPSVRRRCPTCRPSRSWASRLRDVRLVRHPGARRHAAGHCTSCATKSRRRWQRRMSFRRWPAGHGAARDAAREWADYLKAELAVYAKIIKDANIKPE